MEKSKPERWLLNVGWWQVCWSSKWVEGIKATMSTTTPKTSSSSMATISSCPSVGSYKFWSIEEDYMPQDDDILSFVHIHVVQFLFSTIGLCPMVWCHLQCLPEVIIPVFELFWNHVTPSLQIIHLLRFRDFTCSDKCTVMVAGWVCGWTNYCWHSGQSVLFQYLCKKKYIPLYPCCRSSPFQNLNQQTAAVESSTCDSSSPVSLCDVLWLHRKGHTHTWEEVSPPSSLLFLHKIRNLQIMGLADQVPLHLTLLSWR